jgi:transcriptional regulator with XRE-family HTH domain
MITKESRGIGERFAELLKANSLSVNAFVAEIGGTTAKYYKLLNGKSKPDFDTIYAVLDRFPDVSAEWFMRGAGPMLKKELLSAEEAERILAENRTVKDLYREEMKRSALMGKTKGAILCPDMNREVRKHIAADSMRLPRSRKTSRSVSVRVPGVVIPNIMDQVREILG